MKTIAMLTAAGDLGHFDRMQQLATGNDPPRSCSPISKARPSWRNDSRPRVTSRWYGDSPALRSSAWSTPVASSAATSVTVSPPSSSRRPRVRNRPRHAPASTRCARCKPRRSRSPPVTTCAADDITVRAGLHWGATLYIGSIVTSGRTEVTALGDEVNEAGTDRSVRDPVGGRSRRRAFERLDTTTPPRSGSTRQRHLHPTRRPRHRNRQSPPRRPRHARLRHPTSVAEPRRTAAVPRPGPGD